MVRLKSSVARGMLLWFMGAQPLYAADLALPESEGMTWFLDAAERTSIETWKKQHFLQDQHSNENRVKNTQEKVKKSRIHSKAKLRVKKKSKSFQKKTSLIIFPNGNGKVRVGGRFSKLKNSNQRIQYKKNRSIQLIRHHNPRNLQQRKVE